MAYYNTYSDTFVDDVQYIDDNDDDNINDYAPQYDEYDEYGYDEYGYDEYADNDNDEQYDAVGGGGPVYNSSGTSVKDASGQWRPVRNMNKAMTSVKDASGKWRPLARAAPLQRFAPAIHPSLI